jgi:hypothetical protein
MPFPVGYINSAHLEALGKVTVAWSHLEDRVATGIGQLLGTADETSMILTAGMSFKQRLDVLNALVVQREPADDVLTAADAFRVAAHAAEEARNPIVHSHWGPLEPEPDKLVRYKQAVRGKRGLRVDWVPMTAEDIAAVADQIWDADQFGATLLAKLVVLPRPT